MAELVRQHEITLVAGASAVARQMLPRLGFTALGELRRYVCIVDPRATAALTGTAPTLWPALPTSRRCNPLGDVIKQVDRFGTGVESLWEAVWGTDGAGTRRSASFLNWRYTDHPRFEYRLFEAYRGDRITGFAAYRVEDVRSVPTRIGRVVEFVSAAGPEGALLRELLADAREQNVALLDLFCSSARLAPALQRSGWIAEEATPAEIPVLFQPPVRGRRTIPFLAHLRKSGGCADIERWYVTKGDGDQDRPN